MRVLHDLAWQSSSDHINPAMRLVAMQLFHYVEAGQDKQKWLEATDALIHKITKIPLFTQETIARIYYKRARVYNRRNTELFNKERANENFRLALKLFEPMNYYDRGFAYFYIGNYQKALVVHNQALEQNPQDVNAYFGRGWAYTNLGEHQQAIDDFECVLKLAPNYDNPGGLYNGFRWAYFGAGKYQEALAANNYFLELEHDDYRYYLFQMRCFHLLKDYQQSTNACNHALELAPKRPEACVEVGWAYFHARNYSEALAYHNQALEQNPQDACAHVGRGWVYYKLEEDQQAIADFEHAAELDPDANPDGRSNGLRWAYFRIGKYQEALAANDYYVKRDPGDYDPYVFRSRCFRSLKDYLQSIDACNHALELAPKRPEAYFQRGLTYLWLKDLRQAQTDFVQSYELKQTNLNFVLMAEWVGLCKEAADPKVLERLEIIVAVESQGYVTHVYQGMMLLRRRHFTEALAELEQALLQKRNDDWEAYFWKGMVYAFLEQDEEAMTAIEKALELELPPILLTPLRWFEQERPNFYEKYVVSLLAKHM